MEYVFVSTRVNGIRFFMLLKSGFPLPRMMGWTDNHNSSTRLRLSSEAVRIAPPNNQISFPGSFFIFFTSASVSPFTKIAPGFTSLNVVEKIYYFNLEKPGIVSSPILNVSSYDFLPISTLSIRLKNSDIP